MQHTINQTFIKFDKHNVRPKQLKRVLAFNMHRCESMVVIVLAFAIQIVHNKSQNASI